MYFLTDYVVNNARPRYLASVEESLNDTANILASLAAARPDGGVDLSELRRIFQSAGRKRLRAKIYNLEKTFVNLRVYVTDHKGLVLFDSRGGEWEGRDFSRWNDVYLTLRGRYGARSTRTDPDDPATSAFYVAAPIRDGDRIIGVLTAVKPKISIAPFIDDARRHVLRAAATTLGALMLLGFLLTLWITRPLARLADYARGVGERREGELPVLNSPEVRAVGEALEKMRVELEGKKYVSRYLQSLTHEIKSPLASIRAAAELLSEDMSAERREGFHRNILRGAGRIQSIVDRLLLLSSLENRRELKEVSPVSAGLMAAETLEEFSPQAQEKGVRLKLFSPPEEIEFRAERFLIRHALLNLLQNALDFTPAGGEIELEARRKENSVVFAVRDDGAGIPAYALPRVFERFYSLARPRGGDRGSGLGLAFVREAALLHGGEITIANRPAGGVAAELSLPVDVGRTS